ncbi:MAG: DNA gyrase/topoisomerase IV subunit A [Flavobacteriales bacterium TMED191]|nr:MAG: DNA gyrase/topoisomerase IV subunit A [Flavobacteriales bacterium TMED191]
MMDNENIVEFSNNDDMLVKLVPISEMYKGWFLDYASYVILERSVPLIYDGLKPVQRRILHSLRELHDGRYHKVANIIGNTMKYHPHGDASIGDALVKVGQKELLIDMQGNWGNITTGDRAAAPRYIEARLTKFALDVVFSPKVTDWQSSYDGRTKEPTSLPIKFPLLLNQGAEGIAVGLSTKILPHNFIELIDASISILKGKGKRIFPDFLTGGVADFSDYNDGKRGGKVVVRAKIINSESNVLKINEIPYNTTTTSLIESILRANEKGKIKIKKIEDNTAENVEILIYLPSGVSVDKTIDALYAFTDCQVSISPLSCVILNDKPVFLGVSEILKISTDNTKNILLKELQIKLSELEDRWQFLSLERIFIENRIYRKIEELTSWDEVIQVIYNSIIPYEKTLIRKVTNDDIVQLTDIKIKKITRYDLNKEQEKIKSIESLIKITKENIQNITEYSISYFKNIKKDHSNGKQRKTEIRIFDKIIATKVAIANQRLYVNRKDGFVGTSLRKDEFVCECSDIDNLIVFKKDGNMVVTKTANKSFVGKDIIHVAVFKKNDERTIYNMIYRDNISNKTYVKRFPVKGVTRDKQYLLAGSGKSTVLYFTANKNGEAEVVSIILRAKSKLKKLKFDIDFKDILIKNRSVRGNIITQHSINRVELKTQGISTLSGKKIWYDNSINRLNEDERGEFLGEFMADDKIIIVSSSGYFDFVSYDLSTHFPEDMVLIEKFSSNKSITAVYFYGSKNQFYIKRFTPELKTKKVYFIDQGKESYLEFICSDSKHGLELSFLKPRNKNARENQIINPIDFISIKGVAAVGNQLSKHPVKKISKVKLENIEHINSEVEDVSFSHNDKNEIDNVNKDDLNSKGGQIQMNF